jgi:tetratricopeptide (TPR) repeat protein
MKPDRKRQEEKKGQARSFTAATPEETTDDLASLYYENAQVLYNQGRKEEASTCLSSAIGAGLNNKLIVGLQEKIRTEYHDNAKALYSQGKKDEAITCLNNAIKLGLGDMSTYGLRDWIRKEMNSISTSIEEYDEVLIKNPKDTTILLSRALAWLSLGNLDKATSDVDLIIEKHQDNPKICSEAYLAKAVIDKFQGKLEDTVSHLKEAGRRGANITQFDQLVETFGQYIKPLPSPTPQMSSSSLPQAPSNISMSTSEVSASSTTTSGPTSSSSLVKAKQDGLELRFKLTSEAMQLHKQGRSGDAILLLDTLIQADPTSHSAYTMRGNIKMEKFPPDLSAIQDFENSLRIKPDGSLLARKGMLWYINGNSERAHSDQDEVLSKYSDDLAAVQLACLNKAILYKLENDQEKADLNLAIAKSVRRSFHGDDLIKHFDFLVSALREHRKIFADQAPTVNSSSISQPAGVLIAPSPTSSHSMSTSLSTSEPTSNQTPIVVAPEISSQVMPAKTEQEQSVER